MAFPEPIHPDLLNLPIERGPRNMPRAGAHIVVTGRVQGVGFRDFAARVGRDLGLYGSVRNLNDGDVAVEVEGERGLIESFIERLTQAVDQQGRVAEHSKQQLANAVLAVRVAETRCASVRKLIERRTSEQRNVAERREQQQTDEAAARATWGRPRAA